MKICLILMLTLAQASDPESVARQAVDAFHSGRYTEAREGLRAAIKYAPQNPGLWAYLGLTEGSLNDFPAAIFAFEKARTLAPADPQVLFNLGLFYGKAGNQEKSREAYRQGLKVQPDDPGANQNYAYLLMQAGLCDQAITPLERLRKLEPANPSVRVSLIECKFKAGRKSEAEQDIRTFLSGSEVPLKATLKTASILAEDGVPGAAEIVLDMAVLRYDDSAEVHAGLGKLLLDRSQYEDAVVHLGRAAQLQPDKPGYSLGLAEALLRWKHYTPALQFLEAVRPKFGTLPDFHLKLGLVLYGMACYPQALAEFESLVQSHPLDHSAWFSLGNTQLAIGKLDDAEHAYRKAIELNSKVSGYYAALGELFRRSDANRVSEAAAMFQQALALNPRDANSKRELALCKERLGDLDAAFILLREVVTDQPNSKETHVALARVCYRLHRKEDGDREKQVILRLEVAEHASRHAAESVPPSIP